MTQSNLRSTASWETKMRKTRSSSFFFKNSGRRMDRMSKLSYGDNNSGTVGSRNFKIPLLGQLVVGHSHVNFGDWQRSIVAVDVGHRRLALNLDKDTTHVTSRTYARSWTVGLTVMWRKRKPS